MNSASCTPEVGALLPPTSSTLPRRRVLYDKPEPCYCKINETTGLIALSLTSFKTLHEKEPLKEQLAKLHRLHLQLDAVVTQHKGVKFSGSSESYLVAKCCETGMEAALAIKNIAEDLMNVNKDVKGAVSFGEVGFALLGSTAWNYQFYGELVSDLKIKVEELRPGELKMMQSLVDVLQSGHISDEEIVSSTLLTELRSHNISAKSTASESDILECPFHAWWASRVQYTDIWVLVLTFIFAAVSIRNQVLHKEDISEVPPGVVSRWRCVFVQIAVLPLFLQIQCCVVNVFAAFGWIINRDWFIRRHSVIMSVVWCTQFFSRAVQAWTHISYPGNFQAFSILRQLLAMNGPEKLLLMTAPVNLWISGCLHWCGFVGSLGTVYRSCLGGNGMLDPTQLPSDVFTTVLVSFFAFFVVPVTYSIRVERAAKKAFTRLNSKE